MIPTCRSDHHENNKILQIQEEVVGMCDNHPVIDIPSVIPETYMGEKGTNLIMR